MPSKRSKNAAEEAVPQSAGERVVGMAARAAGARPKASHPRRQSAEQAILGILESEPGPPLDDLQLADRLDKLPPAELDRLARLIAVAQAGAAGTAAPLVDRLGKQMDGRQIHIDIGGNNNTVSVNLGRDGEGAAAGGRRSREESGQPAWKRRNNWSEAGLRNSWGRRVGSQLTGFLRGR